MAEEGPDQADERAAGAANMRVAKKARKPSRITLPHVGAEPPKCLEAHVGPEPGAGESQLSQLRKLIPSMRKSLECFDKASSRTAESGRVFQSRNRTWERRRDQGMEYTEPARDRRIIVDRPSPKSRRGMPTVPPPRNRPEGARAGPPQMPVVVRPPRSGRGEVETAAAGEELQSLSHALTNTRTGGTGRRCRQQMIALVATPKTGRGEGRNAAAGGECRIREGCRTGPKPNWKTPLAATNMLGWTSPDRAENGRRGTQAQQGNPSKGKKDRLQRFICEPVSTDGEHLKKWKLCSHHFNHLVRRQ
ncbi:hypothetical protein EJ06DRAFT_520660 [Trichodelitschia bisporula]|uniref:Uncharacterized protein n=1 Tax=Trichodelitschia bisporula TaxID=703511 RepID=A0A6G1I085_9PEZI|nr:hypothetical protein EJ06DRAFT_520660 [Trichodelitschia bisporula]